MHKGILKWLRVHGGLPSLVLLLAILAPVLFSAIPASAEQLLIRDLSFNSCTQNEGGGSHEQLPISHEHCCILCSPSGHVFGIATTAHLLIPPLLKIRSFDVVLAASEIMPLPPDLRATAPRGPPTV
jgi:hypothetical protein